MEKVKMILDCDTGHDDAIAIMFAAGHPDIELLGITTVSGNVTLDKTTSNTLQMCQQLHLDVPVYAGMDRPLVREAYHAPEIHGETGLDGIEFEELTYKAQPKHAVNFLIDTFMASDGDITLVPVGPLTNVAMALRLEPRIAKKMKRIVLMGGSCGLGNSTPSAEFNIYADPEAAHVVFHSGVDIVMMGLDLTLQAETTGEIVERMHAIGNKAGKLFGDIMSFTIGTVKEKYGKDACAVHDVTAVAYLVAPELFETVPMYTDIDINHGISYGRTVCDCNHVTGLPANAHVGMGLNVPKFWELVESVIRRYE
ncbi:MAG: nucleoside hydrolase [Erysipelotrichaceae bacterium]|nr:nucleoside hydrolase [Erysipelotrichaceae bacterium]